VNGRPDGFAGGTAQRPDTADQRPGLGSVQRHAHTAWNREGGDFRTNLEADPDVTSRLSPDQLAECFSTELHQDNLGVIWERLGI